MPSLDHPLLGHSRQIGQLLNDIAKRNVAHAYLFSGAKHLGKFTVARWFATRLLCDSVPPDQVNHVEQQIERMIHQDFLSLDQLWIEEKQENWEEIAKTSNIPQNHRSKAPKARTDSISIDDVRALQERLHETGSGYLCCLVRSIERMQPAAANAFLKILEEPPKRVVFILTTESQAQLLPTIISRTRVMQFSQVAPAEIRSLLEDLSEDDAMFISHISQGAPGKAIALKNDKDALRVEKQLHAQAKQFWQAPDSHHRMQSIFALFDKENDPDAALLHIGMALREYPSLSHKAAYMDAYMELVRALETNAHKGLLLERFALAVGSE